ncbi:Uncharacterised protein [uncultured archaeon]|nr:Uncharacterised protein [uncultured archaeon]
MANGKVVGILADIASNGSHTVYAVRIQELAAFVNKVQPYLHARLFPEDTRYMSPVAADAYPPYLDDPKTTDHKRQEESPEVKAVRASATKLEDSLRTFVATQSFEWGNGMKEPQAHAEYEIQVLNGWQKFREPGTNKFHDSVEFPAINNTMVPGGEWSELPKMVGNDYKMHVRLAGTVTVAGKTYKVFQWRAGIEDEVCQWRSVLDLGFKSINKDRWVACQGEVWTDVGYNIVRMSEHDDLGKSRWHDYQAVVLYDWLKREGEEPLTIPISIATQVGDKDKVYWCRGLFTDYRQFQSAVKMRKASAR